MNILSSCPPVYTLPGTWTKCNAIIPHYNADPKITFAISLGVIVVLLIGYGIYMTFGRGGKDLKDEIKEHARMHELGIAHGHEGRNHLKPNLSRKAQEQDYPQHHHE